MLTGYQGPESCWDLGDVDRKCSLYSQSRESHLVSLCDLHQGVAVDKPGASVLTGLNYYSWKSMYLTLFTLLSWHLQLFNGCKMSFQSWYSGCSTQIPVLPERFWLLIKKRVSTFLRRSTSVLNADSTMGLLTLGWEDRARRWLWVGHLRLQCFRAESGSCTLLSPGRVCTEARNTGDGR